MRQEDTSAELTPCHPSEDTGLLLQVKESAAAAKQPPGFMLVKTESLLQAGLEV